MNSTKHFSKGGDHFFSCPCCGDGGLSISILLVLEDVRLHFGVPVKITSGARCIKHNASVGGAPKSQHVTTPVVPNVDAVDIAVKGVRPQVVFDYLESRPYANLLGLGLYNSWTHVDTRGHKARW